MMADRFPYPPHLIRINMIGGTPLYRSASRAPILDLLLSKREWTPETVNVNDEPEEPFSRKEALTLAGGRRPSDALLFVHRKRALAYELMLKNEDEPSLSMKFRGAKERPRDLPEIFALADALACVYQPDLGWVHVSAPSPPWPVQDPDLITQMLMDDGSKVTKQGGAGGLALRTYFGPYVIRQIGEELLLSVPPPCDAATTSWGGIRVDLAREPWTADAQVLRMGWRNAMEHLKPARFFSTPTVLENGAIQWERAANADPGGRVRTK